MNRRNFLKIAGMATAATVTTSGMAQGMFQPTPTQTNTNTTKLSMRDDGHFKILQLTDTHYVYGRTESERALQNVRELIRIENPDLIIHTGDIIFGKPAEESFRTILQPLSDSGIPWAVTLGNHDGQFGLNRTEAFQLICSLPGNVNHGVEGIYGNSNDMITLSTNDGKVQWAFYLFDSGDAMPIDSPGLKAKRYDYIHFDQIAWYRQQSDILAQANDGQRVPAMAFFHIPLQEFNLALRFDVKRVLRGTLGEEPYSSGINMGLWASMRELGDVQAIVCGHDHDNDYACKWNETLLCFGRYSGCDTVYNHLKPNGARLFDIAAGDKRIHTWIRLMDGEKLQEYTYPDDFNGM